MGGWVRYLQLQAKAKTGFSAALIAWGVVAFLALVLALFFLFLAAFIWLADRYNPLAAALIMAGVLVLIALIAAAISYAMHSSAVTQARLALAERKHQPWLNPAMLSMGIQVGRNVGWSRLLSLAAAAVLAAGLGREWLGGRDKPDKSGDGDTASDD